MIIAEKMASYGSLVVAMKQPEFSECVSSTKIGKPDIQTYGMTGYIPVSVEFDVCDIKKFAELWNGVCFDKKYTDEIVKIEGSLGNARC